MVGIACQLTDCLTCLQTITTALCFWFPHAAEPPQITTHPQEVVDAVLGECVMFGIEAIGTEPLSYQWKHKTGEGSGGWQMCDLVGAKSSKLTVLNVQKSNEGSYHCTVNNHVGSETSECATLTVGELPHILQKNVSHYFKKPQS